MKQDKEWKIIVISSFFVLLTVIFGLQKASAAQVSFLSDTLSSHIISDGSNHAIVFVTPSGVGAGETITITFYSDFTIGSVDYTDIDIEDDGLDLDLAASASGATWGAQFSGNTLTITSGTGVIAAGSAIEIEVGTNATYQQAGDQQITNPATESQYLISIAGTFGDSGSLYVYVMEDNTVQVTALVLSKPNVIIQWAVPQVRVGDPETNDDEVFYLTLRTPNDDDDSIVYTMPTLVTTTVEGTYLTAINMTAASGTYDIGIKGESHLTQILNDVFLEGGATTTLNFTQLDNSAPKGDRRMVAGDINGEGTSPDTLGDDKVNSVDLSGLLIRLNDLDPTGNNIRANFNQDTKVNSVDLSVILGNLNEEGEN